MIIYICFYFISPQCFSGITWFFFGIRNRSYRYAHIPCTTAISPMNQIHEYGIVLTTSSSHTTSVRN